MKGALLGLLLERPGHGYDLANRLVRRLGPAWRIEPRRIYPLLEALERAGLASSVAQQGPGGSRQQRIVYSPTAHAGEALAWWMQARACKEPVRVGMQARLAVARPQDVPQLLRALDDYERDCFAMLAATEAESATPTRSWMGLLIDLTREAADAQLRAELGWIVMARRRIKEFGAAG